MVKLNSNNSGAKSVDLSDTDSFKTTVESTILLISQSRDAAHIRTLYNQISELVQENDGPRSEAMNNILKEARLYKITQQRLDELKNATHVARTNVLNVVEGGKKEEPTIPKYLSPELGKTGTDG